MLFRNLTVHLFSWLRLCSVHTTALTIADMREVKSAVYDARAKWRAIGLELGISKDDLDCIEKSDIDRCLEEMLALWLRRPRMNPSWESLVGALKSATVDRMDVAEEIGMFVRCCKYLVCDTLLVL